ncbi:glycine betaine/L-proline ABC transporter ATP-binding protein [Shewanella sp. D64]|uniref:quaternary amine ABC transporter ATP-binding protein n=1 Tax=unclassified Shewanella TaxID=196818 RepID=UPI0022BA15E2|nr:MULTISPECIES: glycine betaine/L-proline ABC transporter ATP-binding protein [unclassified Shewanella]MEC4725735.1 glycine betaine/L-proline ABC transporter ATP-binding protein [Shewanella sp. D64]MEC4737658.1 glycine betaine/L-proline ABC transporter ATP-binding protein [Shewanella sp. E94]WBJ93466.1 glycine betaine/L-proline ABC transporter ATP-binding protein [Shewanella sp. MTB7]
MSSEVNKQPLIQIKDLYKVFGKKPASVMPLVREGLSKDDILAQTGHTLGLKAINLDIYKGEIFVIMGLSGSGKSTLIRHFNRLIDPTEGQILVEGIDVMKLNTKELETFRRQKMAMVFQRFGLMPHRNVQDNVAYGLSVQGVDKASRNAKANKWLKTVGLAGYEKQYPSQLSGGQQQRVGLARALCTDAEILLMDEAFSALDPLIRSEMQDQLVELQKELNKTIIFITHDLDEALRIGDRIAILKDGELIQLGEPVDILLNPADDYVEAFVKDVNRPRALTVETVMKPPAYRLTADTIGEALKQMRHIPANYAYYMTDDGFQGVVCEKALEVAARSDDQAPMDEFKVEDMSPLSPDAPLESIIPATMKSDFPLPVVDDDGALQGLVSREDLAEVLSGFNRNETDGERQNENNDK